MIRQNNSYKYGKYHPDPRYNNDKCYYCENNEGMIMRGLCYDCRQDRFLLIDKERAKRKFYLSDKEIDNADLFLYMNTRYIIDEIEELAEKTHSYDNMKQSMEDKRRQKRYWDNKNYVSRNERLEQFIRDNILDLDYKKYIRCSKMYRKIRADDNISFVSAAEEIMIKYRRKSAKDYEIKTRTDELEKALAQTFDKQDIIKYIRDLYEYGSYIYNFNIDSYKKCPDDNINNTLEQIKKKLCEIKKREVKRMRRKDALTKMLINHNLQHCIDTRYFDTYVDGGLKLINHKYGHNYQSIDTFVDGFK